ncbi:MAG: T9SS type A sorting domain-containing protein [Ignavibacteria bacterium]
MNISTDGGISWSQPVNIPVTQFYEIALDYTNPLAFYGGTQDNNTIRTLSGKTNDWKGIYGGDGFYCAVDFTDPDIIYAEYQNGVLGKSVDGGNTFFIATNGISPDEPKNWSTPVIMDPHNSRVLYYGTNRIYRTTDGATSWKAVSGNLTIDSSGNSITTISVVPSNQNVIYVGTDDGQVRVSKDYGQSWNRINNGLPNRWVTRVVADPKKENVVYVTFSGLKWRDPQSHVFRSDDYGQTWQDISSNLPDAPVNAFAVDLNDQNILYLGSDVGAFVSFNLGQSWQTLGMGLPVVPVNDMKIHPISNYLVIGTHGRSMYKINLNTVTSINSLKHGRRISGWFLSQNYPNPFNPSTRINYSIPEKSFVTIKVYDIQGKETAVLVNEDKTPGEYSAEMNAGSLASGIYIYKIQAGSFSEVKKMILLR